MSLPLDPCRTSRPENSVSCILVQLVHGRIRHLHTSVRGTRARTTPTRDWKILHLTTTNVNAKERPASDSPQHCDAFMHSCTRESGQATTESLSCAQFVRVSKSQRKAPADPESEPRELPLSSVDPLRVGVAGPPSQSWIRWSRVCGSSSKVLTQQTVSV